MLTDLGREVSGLGEMVDNDFVPKHHRVYALASPDEARRHMPHQPRLENEIRDNLISVNLINLNIIWTHRPFL